MWRPPVLLAPVLPAADDPAFLAILDGLGKACACVGVRLTLRLLPDGPEAVFAHGQPSAAPGLTRELGIPSAFEAILEVWGDPAVPSAPRQPLENLLPLLGGALLALLERSNAAHQVEALSTILGAATDAALLLDVRGEILWANNRGDEILALHTLQPMALLDGAGAPAPLLHLVTAEMSAAQRSGDRIRHQYLTTGDGGRWRLEILTVSGLACVGCCLVILSPVRLPTSQELATRFSSAQVSARESEVLAQVLRGLKVAEIAAQMDLSEYTVKDHLKHAYAKLGITSRGQLLSRIASSTPLGR
jgi:DNA-binding CsgD family transcriptional regulator